MGEEVSPSVFVELFNIYTMSTNPFYNEKPVYNNQVINCACLDNINKEGDGTPLHYSCLENPMDRGARWATVHGVAKSWTRLSNFTYLLTYCVSVSGSLGIVELNKIHALRKLEICE